MKKAIPRHHYTCERIRTASHTGEKNNIGGLVGSCSPPLPVTAASQRGDAYTSCPSSFPVPVTVQIPHHHHLLISPSLFFLLTEVKCTCNAVLVSGVQHKERRLHVYWNDLCSKFSWHPSPDIVTTSINHNVAETSTFCSHDGWPFNLCTVFDLKNVGVFLFSFSCLFYFSSLTHSWNVNKTPHALHVSSETSHWALYNPPQLLYVAVTTVQPLLDIEKLPWECRKTTALTWCKKPCMHAMPLPKPSAPTLGTYPGPPILFLSSTWQTLSH